MRLAEIPISMLLLSVFVTVFELRPVRAADTVNDQLSAAMKIYYQGQVDAAIEVLKPVADQALSSAPSFQGKAAVEYLLDVCVSAWDFGCVNEYWPKYARLVGTLTDVPEAVKLTVALEPSYYAGVAAWLSGNRKWAEEWMRQWPESGPEVPWAPRDYIRRQLVRAKLHMILDQRDAARLCVDRALASIASIENAGSSLFELSVWFFDAIADLLALGDTERAIGLSLTNARVGQNIFPVNSIEYFRLLRIAAETYEAAGMIPQAKDSIERSLVVLSHVRLNPRVQEFIAADAITFATLICVFNNDMECAHRHLDEHPLHAKIADIRARGVLQTVPEVTFMATRALINAGRGGTPTIEDLPLLSKPLDLNGSLPMETIDRLKVYQQLGHALVILHSDPLKSSAEIRGLAPEIIRVESHNTDAVGFLPRRGLIEQLILALAADSFHGEQLDAESGDTLVRLLDVAARNGQTYSSEALGLVATARTDEIRADIKDLLRLRSRRESTERLDMARMLAAKPSLDPTGKAVQPTDNFTRRSIYSDYGTLIMKISARLQVDQPDLISADAPPTLEQVQSSLRDHEVILSAPVVLGNLGHLCIRKDLVRFTVTPVDGPTLSRDIRLLQASLSSQNEPSPELDSQYPISAARQLYDAFVAPAEGCFQSGDSIIWVGLGTDTVPLGALLSSGSATDLQKRPLADWPWLLKEAAVSHVGTMATFVALRHRPAGRLVQREAQFLGIGDPSFAGSSGANPETASFAMRGAVGVGTLAALPQLPDTRAEIAAAASMFGDRQTQLLGDAATEADLRRLPLESFTYIEFATHGLVRQDIAGLNEAAIALTPGTTSDSFNDGLLTASEIADLPLKARFVALSACNTGLLDFTKFASEVPGLSEAFEVAGVPATLGTLWPVESDASRQIVEGTFERLVSEKVGPAVALSLSQRHYLAHAPSVAHQHPRFWAPFAIFGDGTTPSEGYASPEIAQLGEVRLLTHSGGEVSSIIEGDSGAFLLRAMGDVEHGMRHSGVTAKLTKGLRVEWVKEDPLVANGQIALRVDGGTFVSGFQGGGVIPTYGTLRFIDGAGNVRQEWEVSRPAEDVIPVAALRVGAQKVLVASAIHTRNADAKELWPVDRLVIAELQLGRDMKTRAEFPIISRFFPSFVGIQTLGDKILITVSKPSGDTLPKPHLDEFHQLTNCGAEPLTTLALLDGKNFSKVWEMQIPDVQFARSFRASTGAIRFVGSVNAGCGAGTRMALWEIAKDRNLINLFTDQDTRESQGRGVLQREDGSLLLFGTSQRTTDVDSLSERDPQSAIKSGGRNYVSFSTRRIDDAVIITLDRTLKLQSKETLRAGADIWVTGALSVGNDIWMYGSLGGQAALMQVVSSALATADRKPN